MLPVDQHKGTTTTILPGGKKLNLTMRDVDVDNSDKLKTMHGIITLAHPSDIKTALNKHLQ